MKVLWLCNVVLPEFVKEFNIKEHPSFSWQRALLHNIKMGRGIELGLIFPIYDANRLKDGIVDGCKYFTFHVKNPQNFEELSERFKTIINSFEPDIIHIWGTENSNNYCLVTTCEELALLDRTIVDIQGLISNFPFHYLSGIPQKYKFLKLDNKPTLEEQVESFFEQGKQEIQIFKKAVNIIGRTDFDKASCTQINPDINYYSCNRILREYFYKKSGTWNIGTCRRHSIFVSQAYYSVKGLHYLLRAMPLIIKKFPDSHIYVAGPEPILELEHGASPYGVYLGDLIKELDLGGRITFLGPLDEISMAEQFLKVNVFVSASTVENNSNSICEAALLGVPIVSSYVGGLYSFLSHRQDLLFYQCDAPYMLAYYVCEIFGDDELAVRLSESACETIGKVVDREANYRQMVEVYKKTQKRQGNGISHG